MTQSTRERAARRLYDLGPIRFRSRYMEREGALKWDELNDPLRAPYFAAVDAVLDEIRKPSEAVCNGWQASAGGQEINNAVSIAAVHGCGLKLADEPPLYSAWRAMIDAIKRGEG